MSGEYSTSQVELGTCDLFGQYMIRTPDDCWHPFDVLVACPPEPSSVPYDFEGWEAFRRAGLNTGRPGREHFVPDPVPAPPPTYTTPSEKGN